MSEINQHQLLQQLLNRCIELEASDIHIGSDWYPVYRVNGSLHTDGDFKLTKKQVLLIGEELLSIEQLDLYKHYGQVDFSYYSKQGNRFRVNYFQEMGKPAIVFRYLNSEFKTLEELNLPIQLRNICNMNEGLVLVTGVTGSGKSTTLATLLHQINVTRDEHILLIEDPIEFIHKNNKSLIHQREVNQDVESFADSLRAALRQDPDVIMVGEMRDLETMRAAITAAETGHLVFSTLHTGDAVGTIDRLVGSFPGDEQDIARSRIADSLKVVVSQRLLPTMDGKSRVAALEILIVNIGVVNLIKTDKTQQIYSMMESGRDEGMQTLEQSLANHVKAKHISPKQAMDTSRNKDIMKRQLEQLGIVQVGNRTHQRKIEEQ